MVNVPFLSLLFLGLATGAILLNAMLRGAARQAAFLAMNLLVLAVIFLGVKGLVSTLVFVALGWVLIQLVSRYPERGLLAGGVALVALFVWMRNYDFLGWFLPDSLRTATLATIGLSFLLFKILHVAIEARSGTLGPITLPNYLNYCLNFSTFSMGPIQRYQDYAGQWEGTKPALPDTLEAHMDAAIRILFGLFRVYVLGAMLQPFMMTYDSGAETADLGQMLLQVYAFYFFLYFNFAGYCDIAIGTGSLLGVRPPENFNWPFLARNVSDFWQRQHRSLTLWLTDYVFTPTLKSMLGGLMRGRRLLAVSVALSVTMLVSGLWHGTTAGFLLFGMAHGTFLVGYHLWDSFLLHRFGRKRVAAWRSKPLVAAMGIFITFQLTAFAFVFFQLGASKGLQLFLNILT